MMFYTRKRKTNKPIEWVEADDIKKRINHLVKKLELNHIDPESIFTLRSTNANTRAYARIWGLPRVWQMVLKCPPLYIIEVISEKFDKESEKKRDEILIHELVHIPKNFSGSLVAHTKRRKGSFHDILSKLIDNYNEL